MESAHPSTRVLIGRQQPLAQLEESVDAASAGHGSLVLVSGEPGIGKTRLAEEATSVAAGRGVATCWGRSYEIDGRPPYWPWVQVLRELALHFGPQRIAAWMTSDVRPLAGLVSELADFAPAPAVVPSDADAGRFRLFVGMVSLVRRAAEAQPLLLVLDDLHWADIASLRLLEYLAHELPRFAVCVVGNYREADIRRTIAAGDIVGGLHRRAASISLRGFSTEEICDFAAASAQAITPSSARWLHDMTDGNPFFVDELLRLVETHGGEAPSGGWEIPHGVIAVIRERLAALPAETVQLLADAAVVRREFDIPLLEACAGVGVAEIDGYLRPAIEAGVVRRAPGGYRFSHALLQEAMRADVSASHRADLHRRCAASLANRDDIDGEWTSEIAYHYREAALQAFDTAALEYSERAGRQALRVYAFEEAAEQFGHAVGLLDRSPRADPPRRCEGLLQLADARNKAGLVEAAVVAYDEAARCAREAGDGEQLARAAIGRCSVGSTWAQFGRSDPALVALLREALAGLAPTATALRARLLARLASELHFAPVPEDTERLSAEAMAMARTAGDPESLLATLPARLRCSRPEQREERLAILDELLGLTSGRGEIAVHAYVWKLSEELQAGDAGGAAITRAALTAAVDELRQPRDRWLLPALRGQRHLCEGRLAEAERAVEEIFALEGLTENARMAGLVLLFLIRREQGRLGELVDGMRSFADATATAVAWRTNLASLYAEIERPVEARAELALLVADGLPRLRRDNTWLLGVAGLAGAVALVGTPSQARIVSRALEPFAGRHVVAASFFYLGPVAYYLGVLSLRQGQGDAAIRLLDEAVAAARCFGAPPWLARCLCARARAGDAAAAGMLSEARDIAATLDLPALTSEIERAAAGVPSAALPERRRRVRLERKGDVWELRTGARSSLLKARRGLDHLVRLLAEPGREFHVMDLAADGRGVAESATPSEALFDERTKRELGERLADLREELAEAEANEDLGRAEKARAEIEAIGAHVRRAVGLGGRDRGHAGDAERARAAVTKALRAAIRQIGEHEGELAAELERAVRTGAFCRYEPIGAAAIEWEIRIDDAGDG